VMEREPYTLIEQTIRALVGNAAQIAKARAAAAVLSKAQVALLDDVLKAKGRSYRDGLLIQLAYGITGTQDLTLRPEGARGLAGRVGRLLASLHIPAVKDANQNVGKNSQILTRGNLAAFDELLTWASSLPSHPDALRLQLLSAAFQYLAAAIAETARKIRPLPEIDRGKLTFGSVFGLLNHLWSTPSGGAHEQFGIAALLHALMAQNGRAEYRVETKNLNASDRSSRTAGDVQILHGTRVVEAFEVTANNWDSKLEQARRTLREHDLGRVHIVGRVLDWSDVEKQLDRGGDVSALSVQAFGASMIAGLGKQFRAVALQRLYELLDRNQSNPAIVNAYVQLLEDHGLTLPPP